MWKAPKCLAFCLAAAMVVPMAACGKSTNAAKTSSSAASQKVTDISILIQDSGNNLENYADSRVQKALAEKAGVRIRLVQANADKISVLLAGGDLPDMVRISTSKFNQMIAGDQVIALDSLLQSHGKDILKNVPETVAFSKKYWSNGKNKTYFLPVEVGLDGVGTECWNSGLRIRWDYYKELGCPQVSSMDDFLNVVAQIVQKHPTTADGKKIYGVSSFADQDIWPYMYPMASIYGYYQINNSKTEILKVDTNQVSNMASNTESPYWKSVEYLYKARKLGILDPDSLTQKQADTKAKATAGQVVSGVITGDYNANNAKDAKGFVNIPADWGFSWGNAYDLAGWPDKCFGITKNCKNTAKAMDFLNYVYSYDGCRTLFSGVEGTDWSNQNGTPTISDSTLALSQKGGDDWSNTGIGFDSGLIGLSPFTVNPADKKPVSLFNDPSVYSKILTPLQQDYCKYYGVTYPQEALEKQVKAGKTKDQSGENTLAAALLPVPSDDITRVDAKVDDLLIKDAAKMIMAKSDAEFDSLKQQTLKDVADAGVKTVDDWFAKAWETAVSQSESYNKK